MTTIIQGPPVVRVTIDGLPVPDVFTATATYGFDHRVSEATVVVPVRPSWARELFSRVVITMGAAAETAAVRFTGYLVSIGWDLSMNVPAVSLQCSGMLSRADVTTNKVQGGQSFANLTDQQQVEAVLTACGLSDMAIGGTGRTLGSIVPESFVWGEGESGTSWIEKLDTVCLGYRTYDTPSGSVRRDPVTITPAPAPAATFTEGLDIEQAGGARQVEVVDSLIVEGADRGDGNGPVWNDFDQDNVFVPAEITAATTRFSSPMIEKANESDPGPGLSCEAVGEWMLPELNRRVYRVTFQTPRDDALQPDQTIRVSAPGRLEIDSTFWVQSVTCTVDDNGFTQSLTCIGGEASSAPVLRPPRADFLMELEQEQVIVDGAPATLTLVRARDVSITQEGSVASRQWTVTGGGSPDSGDGPQFLTAFTDIGSVSITLTVTDSTGASGTTTKVVDPGGIPLQRVIDVAEKTDLCLYNGSAWVTQDVGRDVLACGNGPLWGAGDRVYRSLDLLATPAQYSTPAPGVTVMTLSAVLGFTDISGAALPSSVVTAGLADGRIAISRDGAQTWKVLDGPYSGTLIWAGASPYDGGEIQVVADSGGWHMFGDTGVWLPIFTPNSDETVTDAAFSTHPYGDPVASSHWFALSGGSRFVVRAEDGATLGFPTMDPPITAIVAICEAVPYDRVYCIDQLGRCYYSEIGNRTMHAGSIVPVPGLQPGHSLVPDGEFPELMYAVFGSAGIYKNVGGLQENSGWYLLRAPGVAGAPADAMLRMVGFGELVVPNLTGSTPPPDGGVTGGNGQPLVVFSNTSTVKAHSLWNGSTNNAAPAGWQNDDFDDSGWNAAVAAGTGPNAPVEGSTALWSSSSAASTTEHVLFRQAFALPLGSSISASVSFRFDDEGDIWLNGVWIAGDTSGSPTSIDGTQTVSFSSAILRPGATNVIAVEGRNDFSGGWASWTVTIT